MRFLTSIEIALLEIWVYPSILSILKTAFCSLGVVQSIGSSVKTWGHVSVMTQVRGIVSQGGLYFYVCLEGIICVNSVFVNDDVLTQVLHFPLFTCARFAQEIKVC